MTHIKCHENQHSVQESRFDRRRLRHAFHILEHLESFLLMHLGLSSAGTRIAIDVFVGESEDAMEEKL